MPLVDANIVLRYILNDHPQLSQQAADFLEQQTVLAPIEVVCEVVYVLQKVYHVSREEIHRKLSDLVAESLITLEKPVLFQHALETYAASSLDIVDAFLSAYHEVEQQQVLTFDEKLQKYLQRSQKQNLAPDK
jgi:predicted nucleic-acid-binding protein